MKVKELIAALQEYDEDMEVKVRNYHYRHEINYLDDIEISIRTGYIGRLENLQEEKPLQDRGKKDVIVIGEW